MSEQRTFDHAPEDDSPESDEIRSSLDETSVGSIPSDWKSVRLEDIVLESGYGAAESSEDFDSEKPRYVRITDINTLGRLKPDTKVSLSQEKSDNYLLENGDLLFARSGASVGKTYLYRETDGNCAYAGYLIRHEIDQNLANPEFLYQYTDSPCYNYWVTRIQRTGAQPNINAREYGNLLIPYPSVEEQRKIATVLSTVDQTIQKIKEIIEQTNRVKKSLIQKFYSRGYYDHSDWQQVDMQDAYMMTRAQKVPAKWDIRQSGDIADVKTGHTPSTSVDEY